jgi:hypothetical protein
MIQVLATYCMYSKEDILNCKLRLTSAILHNPTFHPVCFDTFDKDGSGTIDEVPAALLWGFGLFLITLFWCMQEEFMKLCAAVNNANPMFPGNFARAMGEFDK